MDTKNDSSKFEILLVDDDIMVQVFHKFFFNKLLLNNLTRDFYNGKDALEYIIANNTESKKYLVFLDINMPIMNGWGLLDNLKEANLKCTVSVIMVTSSIDPDDSEKAKNYDLVTDYIQKPLSFDLLKKILLESNLPE